MTDEVDGACDALAQEITALSTLPYAELQAAWRQHLRYPAPKKIGRAALELGIAWTLQERAHGGLTAVAKRRLNALARTLDAQSDLARERTTSLRPGARLLRDWGGETHEVLVTDEGFIWRGQTWASLSIIAREITGSRWSGPRFFGLNVPATKHDDDIDA